MKNKYYTAISFGPLYTGHIHLISSNKNGSF
jgi:hypothetical protein